MGEKIIDVRGRYSREIDDIKNKFEQLEEERIYEPRLGKHSKMDGSLYSNITQLKEMFNDLINKIECNKQSENERLGEYFNDHKI